MVSVTYDPEAKAMYVRLEDQNVSVFKTIYVGEGKYLDVSESNKPVGLEIIFPESMSKDAIEALMKPKSQIELIQ